MTKKILKFKKNKFKLLNRNLLDTKKFNLYDIKSKNLLFIANFKSISNLVALVKNLKIRKRIKE